MLFFKKMCRIMFISTNDIIILMYINIGGWKISGVVVLALLFALAVGMSWQIKQSVFAKYQGLKSEIAAW